MKNKFKLKLVGEDGNAFVILGKFQKKAIQNGWDNKEIDEFINEATSGNYDHLLQTVMKYTK